MSSASLLTSASRPDRSCAQSHTGAGTPGLCPRFCSSPAGPGQAGAGTDWPCRIILMACSWRPSVLFCPFHGGTSTRPRRRQSRSARRRSAAIRRVQAARDAASAAIRATRLASCRSYARCRKLEPVSGHWPNRSSIPHPSSRRPCSRSSTLPPSRNVAASSNARRAGGPMRGQRGSSAGASRS